MSSLLRLTAPLVVSLLAVSACKTPPKSTTTTRVQSTTSNDSGEKASSDTKETTIEHPDGSQTVKRSETTNTTVPAPAPTN